MKSLLRAIVFALCTVVVVTGCGTTTALMHPASSSNGGVFPRQRAEGDAAAILASFVLPPGARRLTSAPDEGAERVPAAAHSVTISALPPDLQSAGKLPAPVTVTTPGEVRRIASLVDGLAVWPPGV